MQASLPALLSAYGHYKSNAAHIEKLTYEDNHDYKICYMYFQRTASNWNTEYSNHKYSEKKTNQYDSIISQ